MTDLRKAAEMALEALEDANDVARMEFSDENYYSEAINALRQALDKPWVGLTADEIWKCNKAKSGGAVEFHICYAHQNVLDFAEAIEAKLKEKNT